MDSVYKSKEAPLQFKDDYTSGFNSRADLNLM